MYCVYGIKKRNRVWLVIRVLIRTYDVDSWNGKKIIITGTNGPV